MSKPYTIYSGKTLHTMTGLDQPHANAVAVQGSTIVATGNLDELRKSFDADIVDFGAATITPGLTDSHSHPISGATTDAVGLDMTQAHTISQAQQLVASYARGIDPDQWVRGWGLNPSIFRGQAITFAPFEQIAQGRLASLRIFDGHSMLVSPKGLQAAGITHPMQFERSSAIVAANPDGSLSGHVLESEAMQLIEQAIPPLTFAAQQDAVTQVLDSMARTGLTGAHVMNMGGLDSKLLEAIENQADLSIKLRVHPVARQEHGADTGYLKELVGQHGRRWSVTGVKIFTDGTIDGGTAWLREPDVHAQSDHGAWNDLDAYRQLMRDLISSGINTVAHAIGDQAVLTHVETVSKILSDLSDDGNGDHGTHSIEHLEMLDDAAIRRIANSPLHVSMMPLHCTRFMYPDHTDNWSRKLGEPRERYALRIKSLIRAGKPVAIGSDWPVADYDPRATIADGILRRPFDEPRMDPIVADESLSAYELLAGYTSVCAEARGETRSGKLAPGYTADLTVFGADPLELDPEQIGRVSILGTVVDGSLVWQQG